MSKQSLGVGRFRDANSPENQAQVQLEAARVLARQGDMEQARHLLRAAVQADPAMAAAWLQLAWLADTDVERKMLLQRVLSLQPGNRQARAELARLQRSMAGPPPRPRSAGISMHPSVLAGLILVALGLLAVVLVLAPLDSSLARLLPTPVPTATPVPTLTPGQVAAQFFPQLDEALAAGNWPRAIEIVAITSSLDPAGDEVRRRANETHLRFGRFLVDEGRVAEALAHFEQAALASPDDAQAGTWRDVTRLYLAGDERLLAANWQAAIDLWLQAEAQMPDYADLPARLIDTYRRLGQAAAAAGDWTAAIAAWTEAHRRGPDDEAVTDLLAGAHRQRGIALQEQGNLPAARADLEAALTLRPEDAEAKTHLDQVMYILFPPKRIEVDISAQRFYAFEGDTLVYKFVTSTGLPGRDTATGHYKILDKIPMAHSTVWNLDMPYWLGIYYVGNIENGIHALPIRPDGSIMWGGLLGQRASYGCIILSTEAAAIIYAWADIGTQVDIYY